MKTNFDTLVINTIVELLDMEDGYTITKETRIEDDLGIDSGLLLELFMMIEEKVPELEIDPSGLRPDQFSTVGGFATLIQSCARERQPA